VTGLRDGDFHEEYFRKMPQNSCQEKMERKLVLAYLHALDMEDERRWNNRAQKGQNKTQIKRMFTDEKSANICVALHQRYLRSNNQEEDEIFKVFNEDLHPI
jgi:hypothetical protein